MDFPNIIKLFDVFDEKDKTYLVTELVTGGELFDRIIAKESYTEIEARTVIKDVAQAVKYLHDLGVIHRDLKV